MFAHQVRREDMQAVFLEYAWDMSWCDPCAAEPLSTVELRKLGVFWLALPQPNQRFDRRLAAIPADVFVTRLHVRYDAAHFPEDLVFQETADRPISRDATCCDIRGRAKRAATPPSATASRCGRASTRRPRRSRR